MKWEYDQVLGLCEFGVVSRNILLDIWERLNYRKEGVKAEVAEWSFHILGRSCSAHPIPRMEGGSRHGNNRMQNSLKPPGIACNCNSLDGTSEK